ncbi:MAG: hypothetical protein JWM85_2114 [Acidimicrobiaceae bacterium]|nr:hypothetical protein [Acidimicrobiaceae bacterium]
MSDDITEFVDLNTLELHLVGDAANRFSPLLAKAAEALDEVRSNQPPQKEGKKMGEKALLKAQLAQAEAALAKAGLTAPRRGNGSDPYVAEGLMDHVGAPVRSVVTSNAEGVLRDMTAEASLLKSQGRRQEAREMHYRLAAAKMMINENQRGEHPRPSRMGPGTVELFVRTGRLGEDSDLGGI